jgi:heme oxygenase
LIALQSVDMHDAGDLEDLPPDLHAILRSATHDVHQRLHRHPGFAAVQDETIDFQRYGLLLQRLHGFHCSFEVAASLAPARSDRLAGDLAALADRGAIEVVPGISRPAIPLLNDVFAVLGARYVIEGSALGGRGLARHLDGLLGADTIAGRTFFIGNGAETGVVWRAYLARLAAIPLDPAARLRVVAAAIDTFVAFETWLSDWDLKS